MSNLKKRILTSLIVFPITIFFIIKGGHFLFSFLLIVFFAANYELFKIFKKKIIILVFNLILILSLYSIYYLSESSKDSSILLLWIIVLCVCSDIGGYVFGKIFKWGKLTTISPNKTLSGVAGSFGFSIISLFIFDIFFRDSSLNFLEPKFFFLALIFSLLAQAGDLTVSFFKRLAKVKDTGKILPGHGGIFDRIDSLIFVAIVMYILYKGGFVP